MLIRQQSSALVSRGRKLVLQYTGGSPCPKKSDKRDAVHDGARYKHHEFDDDEEEEVSILKDTETTRRKSATISFLCDRDPINTHAAASFVAVDPDECAYFFEVRSQHACAGVEPHTPGSVGPGSVFVIIFFIAVLVYLVGGVFYQRTVAHARGWRQLPNYSLWAGIWSFISVSAVPTGVPARLFAPFSANQVPGYGHHPILVLFAIPSKQAGLPLSHHLSQRKEQKPGRREPSYRSAR